MDLINEIFTKAKALMREELPAGTEGILREMCAAARDELSFRLKAGIGIADIHDSFVRAAGTLALSLYMGLEPEVFESFSAGSISVKRQNRVSSGASVLALRRQAELMLMGYLEDQGFDFRAVRA
ncbi:MAG: hypothetical protein RSF77_02885 [Oscillospiraceae bacterium]